MKLNQEEKRRISSGDVPFLKKVLSLELEEIKNQLLSYRRDGPEYDNVLKGKGSFIKELLELLA
jgi:hypothetical protein